MELTDILLLVTSLLLFLATCALCLYTYHLGKITIFEQRFDVYKTILALMKKQDSASDNIILDNHDDNIVDTMVTNIFLKNI